jgi:hypothetical protein
MIVGALMTAIFGLAAAWCLWLSGRGAGLAEGAAEREQLRRRVELLAAAIVNYHQAGREALGHLPPSYPVGHPEHAVAALSGPVADDSGNFDERRVA